MTDKPPVWAIERACQLLNEAAEAKTKIFRPSYYDYVVGIRVAAGLVAKYEKEPVSPDLLAAREAFANLRSSQGLTYSYSSAKGGYYDNHSFIVGFLAARKTT